MVQYDTTVSSGKENDVRPRSFKTDIVWYNDETAPLSIKFLRLACANYKLKENEETYLKTFGNICKGMHINYSWMLILCIILMEDCQHKVN